MLRLAVIVFALTQLLLCLAGGPRFRCGSSDKTCSIQRSICCSKGAPKSCPAPAEKQKQQPNAPAAPSGCCVFKPNCCVFLVPEAPEAVSFPREEKIQKNGFGEPSFAPQFVYLSHWRPPAV